jgi:RNA polymerase sigma-70 factor (ECF subfamily)
MPPAGVYHVSSVNTNDDSDFERLMRENRQVVHAIAYGVLRSDDDARDVTQETFVRAYEHLGSLQEAGKFRAWIATIGRRLALNRLRANRRTQRREEAAAADAPAPFDVEGAVTDRLLVERVRAEIDRLPQKLRETILLSAVDDLDTSEVARILRIPEGTVRSRLHLARKALLKALDR